FVAACRPNEAPPLMRGKTLMSSGIYRGAPLHERTARNAREVQEGPRPSCRKKTNCPGAVPDLIKSDCGSRSFCGRTGLTQGVPPCSKVALIARAQAEERAATEGAVAAHHFVIGIEHVLDAAIEFQPIRNGVAGAQVHQRVAVQRVQVVGGVVAVAGVGEAGGQAEALVRLPVDRGLEA